MRRSRPRVDGSVVSSRSRMRPVSASASRTSGLSGSTALANRRFESVYSWPQYTLVAAGRCCDAVERIEHLRRRALEQAAAAGAEQRVAAEQGAVSDVGDVAERVPGIADHGEFEPEVSKPCRASVVERLRVAGHPFAGRSEDRDPVPGSPVPATPPTWSA